MVRRCIVSYCKNEGRHIFPKDIDRRKLWIKAILKPKSKISAYSRVCSAHFRLSDFAIIPSYWNNYYPARTLKKSAVPSVFDWNRTEDDEQQSSSIEDTLSVNSDLLVVELDELLPSVQDTVSFNPEQVKATYSRGQAMKPNDLPSQNNKQTQNLESITFPNAKNINCYTRLKPNKAPAHVDNVKIEDNRFLIPAATDDRKRKISTTPTNNSKIVGKVSVSKTDMLLQKEDKIKETILNLPQNNFKIQDDTKSTCLPPIGTIKRENDVETFSTDDILPIKGESMFSLTSFLCPGATIKMEKDIEKPEDRLVPCLPAEVTVKTEADEEKCTMIEVEIDFLPQIKKEINEEMADNNL